MHLVALITPFLHFSLYFVRSLLSPCTISKVVLDQLAHGTRPELIVDLYNVEASIIGKYTLIVCDILSKNDMLYGHFIQIPISTW